MDAQVLIALATLTNVVLTFCLFIVLAAAAIIASNQLRLMRRDSMRSFVKNLMEQWMVDKIVDARNKILEMLKKESPKSSNKEAEAEYLKKKLIEFEEAGNPLIRHLLRIPHYFEMVSILVEADPDALEEVLKLFRETIIYFYELYEPWIIEKRKQAKMPTLYIEFQKLYEQAYATRQK